MMQKNISTAVIIIMGIIFCYGGNSHNALAGIIGSAHDFSSEPWSGNSICSPCHTPHNANTTVDVPLWNHEVTQQTFTPYTSPTLTGVSGQLGYASLVCLSCHDGTVALDSFGGNIGSDTIATYDSRLLIGTDHSDDHPVGIEWSHQDAQQNCGSCHDLHGTITKPSDLPFFDGKVECATCHDPHNKGQGQKLLRLSNISSALCLYCHAK